MEIDDLRKRKFMLENDLAILITDRVNVFQEDTNTSVDLSVSIMQVAQFDVVTGTVVVNVDVELKL